MYTRNFRSFKSIFSSFKHQLIWYVPYVTAVYLAYSYFDLEYLDIKMSIAMLLGFRTSASYDRWWEARKIWGGIVNDSHSLIRQLKGFTGHQPLDEGVIRIANYQMAWLHALKDGLRGLDDHRGFPEFLSTELID